MHFLQWYLFISLRQTFLNKKGLRKQSDFEYEIFFPFYFFNYFCFEQIKIKRWKEKIKY